MTPTILLTLLLGVSLGTTITLSSSHWLLAWMGLELNTLAMIPLMAQHHHPRAVEAATKYFLTQAAAAATLLFAGTYNAWLTGQWDICHTSAPVPTTLITLALAFKIGLAPLHIWLPEVLQGLDYTTGLILSTWQKLAPLALLLQIQPANSNIMVLLGLLSTFIGGWGGMNQTQLRKILAYSSIAHLGWMILVLKFSPSLSLLTLIIYFFMTASVFLTFKLNKASNINMLSTSWAKAPTLTAITPLILLSLAGLPPLTGFMPKWLILQELTKQDLILTATIIALTALLSLYFYLRLSYAMTLTLPPNNSPSMSVWRLQSIQPSLPLTTSMSLTIHLLPLTPAITTLLAL
nr:NADH dehydrogenase subunit 2 [Crenicichla cf. notophthalmus LP-2021]